MTQFNNRYNVTVRDEFDHCEHLSVGVKAYRAVYENDCCGTVGVYACCKECSDALDKQEDEELVTCDDCGGEFQRKDTHEWKPYDFYAPQGDEPMIICKTCRTADKHLDRARTDRADYNAEFGYDDDDLPEPDQLEIDEEACQLDHAFDAQTRGRAGEIDPELFKEPLNIPFAMPLTEPDIVVLHEGPDFDKFRKFLDDERGLNGDQVNFIKLTDEEVVVALALPTPEEEKAAFRKRWNIDDVEE